MYKLIDMTTIPKWTVDEVIDAIERSLSGDSYTAICLECGASRHDLEPDTHAFKCEECKKKSVFSVEEINIRADHSNLDDPANEKPEPSTKHTQPKAPKKIAPTTITPADLPSHPWKYQDEACFSFPFNALKIITQYAFPVSAFHDQDNPKISFRSMDEKIHYVQFSRAQDRSLWAIATNGNIMAIYRHPPSKVDNPHNTTPLKPGFSVTISKDQLLSIFSAKDDNKKSVFTPSCWASNDLNKLIAISVRKQSIHPDFFIGYAGTDAINKTIELPAARYNHNFPNWISALRPIKYVPLDLGAEASFNPGALAMIGSSFKQLCAIQHHKDDSITIAGKHTEINYFFNNSAPELLIGLMPVRSLTSHAEMATNPDSPVYHIEASRT